ncbi:MAG: S8 family serine peptidase [Candidatus Eisenbacteria bacterium]
MKTSPPRLALLSLVVLLVAALGASAASPYDIELMSRTFEPAPALRSNAEDVHVVIQFVEIPTLAEREELASSGITLYDYIPNYAWTASAKAGALQTLDSSRVRAVFTLAPDDKISRRATGRGRVRAFVYPDVVDATSVLERHGTIVEVVRNVYTIELQGDVRELAAEDIVKFVDGTVPDKIEDNDDIRDNINADEVQTSPYDLHGTGIYAAMWDNGSVSTSHNDFAGRLVVADGSGTGSHPTACAGMLAGDGSRSVSQGGTPYQWRGVADDCNLASYSWPNDIPDMDTETAHAISNYDIVVSSNSWSWGLCPSYCYYYGEYDDYSQNYDKIVSGSQGKRLSVVFSAGNDGDCTDCASELPDFPYGTIPGPGSTAKNTICVGSNNADNDALSWYSSMGPTVDGRLKPDIVAPGCKSSAGITTTGTSNNYVSSSCGTSYSCPVISGCVVLTQEDYMDKFGGEAWPSTVKALLLQGAEDLGNTGPDYQFGFGRVHIQNTIDIVRTDDGTGDLIKQDSVTTGETWTYNVDVSGESELKVTLVWDDYFGSYEGSGKRLVNDLDLEIVSPGATTYYPWHLDPNNPSNNATTGVDDLNNAEQVIVNSPANGTWTIRVIATTLPQPDQDFSLVTNVGPGAGDPPPAAPTGLDATGGSGEGEIDVDWNDNSEPDFDHYRLERATNPLFSGAVSFTTATSDYADSGLTPGSTYYYRAYAVDVGANESGAGNTDSSPATDLPPAAPTGLGASPGAGEGEIDVDWNDNGEADFDHYRLQRATNPSFSGASSFTMSSSSYADAGLTPGDTYYYRVYAVDAGSNESAASASDYAIATDLAPAAPTGLALVPGPAEGEIFVSWSVSPESDIDRYRLERSLAPDFEPGSEPFEGAVASYQDSGLVPGALYYYRVYAIDAGENVSPPSSVESDYALDLPPAAPTGLAASPGVGEGEIDLDWSDNGEADFDHYRLERAENPAFSGATSFITSSSDYADSGLTPGGLYYYRVFAYDANSNVSDPSVSDSEFATDLPPAVPTGLAAVPGPGEGEIEVSWSANTEPDFDHYRLERHTDPGFGPGSDPFEQPATYFPDSGLVPGDEYFYRVIAVDAGGNESAPSTVESAIALDLDPAAPTGLAATPGTGEGEIDVDWDDNGEVDFDHYRVERADNPSFSGATSFTTATSDHADSGLTPGQTYYYRAFAVDANANESAASAYDSAIATDLPPAAPTGLALVPGPAEGEIFVSWNPNSEPDLDRYRLERSLAPDFEPGSEPFEEPAVSYQDSGLIPGEEYYYRVYAIDTGGNESAPSAVESAIALDLVPAAPTGLTAVPGGGEGEVDVDWSDNGEVDFDHYRLERAENPAFSGATSFTPATSDYADSGLTPGQTYYYRAFAVDANSNESGPSNTGMTDATDVAPTAPTGLAAADGPSDGEIQLTWDANLELDLDRYRLERDTTAVFGAGTAAFETTDLGYLDSGLALGVTYYYRLFAIDQGENVSAPSGTVEHTLVDTDVPEDLVAAVSFMRPNPFTEQTSIAYAVPSDGAHVTMRVYDITGRLVTTLVDADHSGGAYETVWTGRDANGANVASGIYFCRAEISGTTEVRKVVLIR